MLLGAAGKEDGFHSQRREWQTVPINSMQGMSVWLSVNEHVSVVGGTWGSLAPNSQFSQVGLCEATQFLQGIVLRHGELANVRSQEAQRDSLRVGCRVRSCFRGTLKAPYHPQQVGCTFGHVWREKMKWASRMERVGIGAEAEQS